MLCIITERLRPPFESGVIIRNENDICMSSDNLHGTIRFGGRDLHKIILHGTKRFVNGTKRNALWTERNETKRFVNGTKRFVNGTERNETKRNETLCENQAARYVNEVGVAWTFWFPKLHGSIVLVIPFFDLQRDYLISYSVYIQNKIIIICKDQLNIIR